MVKGNAARMERQMAITWKRVPRQGFMNSHWIGFDDNGNAVWKISQRKPASASKMHNTRVAYLVRLPSGGAQQFPNVAAAKQAAQ
jgi:hypothetical protein